jgi:ATP-binding cassette subfamily F protein 3
MDTELLAARGLTHYADREVLFTAASLTLGSGQRIALTGSSGSGKSTLLGVLAGSIPVTEGSVRVAPGVGRILVRQRGGEAAGSVWDRAELALEQVRALERQLRSAEGSLGESGGLERYAELNDLFEAAGGYRAEATLRELLTAFGIREGRWQERFRDLSAGEQKRVELASALAAPPGVLLLDEPDDALDAEARSVLLARLRKYPGGVIFSSHDRAFIDAAATHVAVLRERQLRVTRGGYTRQQQLLGRAGGRVRSWQLDSSGPRGQLLRLGPLELPLPGAHSLGLTLPELRVDAGDRIVLLGPNGSGKSTLLGFLAASLHAAVLPRGVSWSEGVRLEHWDQQQFGLDPEAAVLSQLLRVTSRERAGQLLGLLRVPYRTWQHLPAELSGGERARVAAARLLAVEANLLLLDEPTAGLDITAIENLQDALLTTQAAVILVTHDLTLASAVADRIWALQDGLLVEYRGGMEGYRAGRRRLEPDVEPQETEAGEERGEAGPGPELTLEAAEDELLAVEASLADPLRLSGRELARLGRRKRELIELVSELIDSAFPAPAPRFSVREAGLTVQADLAADTLEFSVAAPVRIRLLRQGGIGHLLLQEAGDSCLLPWARVALLNAATRLAFYCLDVRVVQHARPEFLPRLPGLVLAPAGGQWFALSRQDFVRREGWQREAARSTILW